jgi:hypothetical protein
MNKKDFDDMLTKMIAEIQNSHRLHGNGTLSKIQYRMKYDEAKDRFTKALENQVLDIFVQKTNKFYLVDDRGGIVPPNNKEDTTLPTDAEHNAIHGLKEFECCSNPYTRKDVSLYNEIGFVLNNLKSNAEDIEKAMQKDKELTEKLKELLNELR